MYVWILKLVITLNAVLYFQCQNLILSKKVGGNCSIMLFTIHVLARIYQLNLVWGALDAWGVKHHCLWYCSCPYIWLYVIALVSYNELPINTIGLTSVTLVFVLLAFPIYLLIDKPHEPVAYYNWCRDQWFSTTGWEIWEVFKSEKLVYNSCSSRGEWLRVRESLRKLLLILVVRYFLPPGGLVPANILNLVLTSRTGRKGLVKAWHQVCRVQGWQRL